MPRGKLSDKQIKYSQLVASGMEENLAVIEAGYIEEFKWQSLNKLKNNKRISARIEMLKSGEHLSVDEVASRADREAFWTSMMNDPKNSGNVRLEASKLLGKAQGDFIDRREVDTTIRNEPVVLIPKISPEDWESFWEEKNK